MKFEELPIENVVPFYSEILPAFINKLHTFNGEIVKLDPLFSITQYFKNYETIMKLIGKQTKIAVVFKKLVDLKCIQDMPPIPKKSVTADVKGYNIIKLKKDTNIYRAASWFYPITHKPAGMHTFYPDVQTAAFFTLTTLGGIETYKTTNELRLLFLEDKDNLNKIIANFIDPIIDKKPESRNKEFYIFLRDIIRFKYDLENKPTEERIKEIKLRHGLNVVSIGKTVETVVSFPSIHCNNGVVSTTVYRNEEDIPIAKFMAYIIEILGYDGTYSHQQSNIYSWVGQRHSEINLMIKDGQLIRDITDVYDWNNWEIDKDFLLPATEFDFNFRDFGRKNDNYRMYKFYKKMREQTITSVDYDMCTLNVNKFRSINLKHSTEEAIAAVFQLFEKYKLKFICIQEVMTEHHKKLNEIAERKGLFTSISKFERDEFESAPHNVVISTAKIEILANKLLPHPELGGKRHYIHFKHPHFSGKTILNTHLTIFDSVGKSLLVCDKNIEARIKQLIALKTVNADYILGDLNITQHDSIDFQSLGALMYSLNNRNIENTTAFNNQPDYIMSKLPEILTDVTAINYKYSDHRPVLGKI